ncbi:kinesin-like protein KIF3A [Agrilus planipennis]|uniref:Kinesin-like protein n=1 Tax=Agrilus planipennis TaxID=224129 RepID=A0A1W4XAT2_AGRPL|nr:kinesin-like protein KIF3A [Agrilus planipennis]
MGEKKHIMKKEMELRGKESVEENICVVTRVRPLSSKEVETNCPNIVSVDIENRMLSITKPGESTNNKPRTFTFSFDYIFPETSSQMDVYRNVAKPIVDKVLEGYNGTLIAYGQTGTGKTFTMSGDDDPSMQGIIPNTFNHIFSKISSTTEDIIFAISVSYLEIYNEEVKDLLAGKNDKKLKMYENEDGAVYVKDAICLAVDSVESITELMRRGNANRKTRATLMNDRSSRSHAIFMINIEQRCQGDNTMVLGKLNLVDLAGSERLIRTQATGDGLKEATNINQSLSVLSNVIATLAEGKGGHVPYRSSKLTRLLQNSLGGNSKTTIIATVSPASMDFEETHSTLRYAARCKLIKNRAVINRTSSTGLIAQFEAELQKLEMELALVSAHEKEEIEMINSNHNMKRVKCSKQKISTPEIDEEVKRQEEELKSTEEQKNDLLSRISSIQKLILVGGENLIEKAKRQQFLLESSDAELKNLDKSHKHLQEELEKKGAERIDVEEKYNTLQEEDTELTKKILKCQEQLSAIKEEYAIKEHEYQRDEEALIDSNRLLLREVQLANVMTAQYIPKEYWRTIESNVQWNKETLEFQTRGVAYTGNNMQQGRGDNGSNVPYAYGMNRPYGEYHRKPRIRHSSVPRPRRYIYMTKGSRAQ